MFPVIETLIFYFHCVSSNSIIYKTLGTVIILLSKMNKKKLFPQVLRSQTLSSVKPIAWSKIAIAAVIASNIWINPALGADPFRSQKPRNIGNQTEAAFNAIFQKGNYKEAQKYVKEAIRDEPDEPLGYAIKASLAYTSNDVPTLANYSKKTLQTAKSLIAKDPLRGNIYAAVGHFLEGSVILLQDGTVKGAPQALRRLRQVYGHLERAESISPRDPELNLLKGYMDLMLAVNLPFSDPEQAIQRLRQNAGPQYLVDRGIAIAYRDLKKYDRALGYVDRALKATAENPELYYLKAQILREQGQRKNNREMIQEAVNFFDQALEKKNQLPERMVKQIARERRRTSERLTR